METTNAMMEAILKLIAVAVDEGVPVSKAREIATNSYKLLLEEQQHDDV